MLAQSELISEAFDHPVMRGITLFVTGLLITVPVVLEVLWRLGKIGPDLRKELYARYRS